MFRIGILGTGVQAMLLGQAARSRQLSVRTFGPDTLHPASMLSESIMAAYDDVAALKSFVTQRDGITTESIDVPTQTLVACASVCHTIPSAVAMECGQDRARVKDLCKRLNITYAKALPARDENDLAEALGVLGLPMLFVPRMRKSDERAPQVLAHREDVEKAWKERADQDYLFERFTNPEHEIACMVVRSGDGKMSFYPLTELIRAKGIVREIVAPATDLSATADEGIRKATIAIGEMLSHVGAMCVTFFVRGNDIYLDTITPTVHFAALWTIENSKTSLYENHIRALCGEALGSGEIIVPSRTVRVFGSVPPALKQLDADGTMVHLYGVENQPEDVPVAHVTVMNTDRTDFPDRWNKLSKALGL